MNGRMSKEARALEVARFAIFDFQEQVGAVIKAMPISAKPASPSPIISLSTRG
jgi:hypothetical protein